MKTEVTCSYCKTTAGIEITTDSLATWYARGEMLAPDASDERIWELLKSTVVCPDCVKEHSAEAGHRMPIGCQCKPNAIAKRPNPPIETCYCGNEADYDGINLCVPCADVMLPDKTAA